MKRKLIIVRGGGDLATGVIHRLWSAGFPVTILEASHPTAIRRQVAYSEAVYEGSATVEEVRAVRCENPESIRTVLEAGEIPLLVDPKGAYIPFLNPGVVVDAIIAKRNLGTNRSMAPLTIGLGPGFVAGEDVDFVIETMRGHNLGRIIRRGSAAPNTGVPGVIGGYGAERVLHAPGEGVLISCHGIGDYVLRGERIAEIRGKEKSFPVEAGISGLIRGLIRDGFWVSKGMKIADIDPRREEYENCFTISDKARCIAGSVLELVCRYDGGNRER